MIDNQSIILIPKREKQFIEKHEVWNKEHTKCKIVGGGNTHIYRIFKPSEWQKLMDSASKGNMDDYTIYKAMLLMGCRYEEARRIQKDRKSFHDGKFIHVTEKKVKRIAGQREIRLSDRGVDIMPSFFAAKKMPTRQTMDEKLKRLCKVSGIEDTGVSVRCLRKTWESWLMTTNQDKILMVVQSQGHNLATAMEHYINLSFTDEDIRQMKPWVQGWRPEL